MGAGFFTGLTISLAIAIGGFLPGLGHAGSPGQPLVLTARHVPKAPAGLDDPVWKKLQPVEVPVRGRESPAQEEVMVATKAVYTDDAIFFLFRWKDSTESVTKESWKFDGQKWLHLTGDEDRIALLFEITRIDGFATKGCAVVCHSPPDVPRKEWKLATQTPAEKGDLWHWKAARSNPYHHADDGWLTVAGNPSGSYRATGRRNDAGEGGDIKNETEDKNQPLYMQDPSRKPSAPGFLLFEEAVKIQDPSLFKANDIITYRMPAKASGSRFDVRASGRYTGDGWTVMLYRKLDTGREDDVAFDPRKNYTFAMALFDDSGDDHSKATRAMTLTFGR